MEPLANVDESLVRTSHGGKAIGPARNGKRVRLFPAVELVNALALAKARVKEETTPSTLDLSTTEQPGSSPHGWGQDSVGINKEGKRSRLKVKGARQVVE